MPATPLVQARELSRRFPPDTWALRQASLDIAQGETVAIMGPSGSGKSTLLALLGLLDTPTGGQYLLDGVDVTQASDRKRTALRRDLIGFVFQAFHLVDHMSVLENVALPLAIQGARRVGRQADQWLERLGLAHRADAFPPTLSGGEKQRVAIARALAAQPPLVLCDEPTGNLDSTNSKRVISFLTSSPSPTTAVVIVTHDPQIARSCSRTIHLADGRAAEDEP